MSRDSDSNNSRQNLDELRAEVESVERTLAREFETSPRILVASVAVVAVIASLALPHTGSLSGLDILAGGGGDDAIVIVSRVFVWLQLLFGVIASGAAILTRRWALAVVAGAGCGVSFVFGLLSVWSRQTNGLAGEPPTGVGAGLLLGWLAMVVLAVVWIKTIWARTAFQRAVEQERRDAAAQWEDFTRANSIGAHRPIQAERPHTDD